MLSLRRPVVVGGSSVAALGVLLALATGATGEPGSATSPAAYPGGVVGATATPTAAPTPSDTSSPTSSGPASTPVAFSAPLAAEPAELAAFYRQRLSWTPCDDDDASECTDVRVPLDYAEPRGAATTIALRRFAAADPATRRGSLFLNPGGPGGSGVDFAGEAHELFGEAVSRRYDLIGFDPRGMGESDPVECLTDSELDELYAADPTPDTAWEKAAARRAPRLRNERCLRRGGPLAARMGSEFVARDLDVLRAAVGDDRLNYYGVSYGTMIGALYADLFTSRVGLMVLDSAVGTDAVTETDPTQADVDASARGWAQDFDDVVDDFATDCGSSVDCPLGEDTAAVSQTLVTFLDRLDRRPLRSGIDSLPRLTEGWAATAISEGLRDRESWPYLVDALDLAVNDDNPDDLLGFAMDMTGRDDDGSYPDTTFGRSHLLVSCSDWPIGPWERMSPSAEVADKHPLWARVEPETTSPCDGWTGVMRETVVVGAEVATPVLVIGNEGDDVTPIEQTEAMSHALVRSRFVTVAADGHGAYAVGNDCADAIVDHYLADALAPEDGYRCGTD
ncbi:MAG: hypothetical protein JWP82_484 [Humibacillus sp.]|nr:hypothetical protein [Humibacillus sp.]